MIHMGNCTGDVPRLRRVVVIFNIYAEAVSRIPCRQLILCKD